MKFNQIFGLLFLFSIGNAWTQLPAKAEDVKPLLIGQKIPSSILKDSKGLAINTKDAFNKKTILVFYRGGWCPYCSAQLAGLHTIEKELQELGYQLVAISPDAPENLQQTSTKNELKYLLLSDAEGNLTKAAGLAFEAPEGYKKLIEKNSNGLNKGFLPVPAVYVLNDKQEIEFMYVSPDFKKRLNVKVLLAVLKALEAK